MIERFDGLIVESLTKKVFTGNVNLTNEEGINFKGFVKNGKRDGECSWLKANGDTIEYQRFDNGERIYSVQFNVNGKRDNLWIQSNPNLEKKDTILIDDMIFLLLKSRFNEIDEKVVSRELPYANLTKKQLLKYNADFGSLNSIEVLEIIKRAYNFRPEKHIEVRTIFKFDTKEVLMGIRLLENENNLHSIGIWEIKSKTQTKKDYVDFDIWSFLNI